MAETVELALPSELTGKVRKDGGRSDDGIVSCMCEIIIQRLNSVQENYSFYIPLCNQH
jgi:hypothetical protein